MNDEDIFVENEQFANIDFTREPLAKGEYEVCTFTDCNLGNVDLAGMEFVRCGFIACNLSLAKLKNTAFRHVQFKDCKLLGLNFENCNEFGFEVGFEDCQLDRSSFYKMKLKQMSFRRCRLHEIDFTESDLSGAVFDLCDLAQTRFEKTNLERADFTTAVNYVIDPELNRMRKAKFTSLGLAGLVAKYNLDISQ
jgi:fluoroquinolone resistance protein